MPTLSLRWIIGLLVAFVIAAGVHLYLTRTYGARGGPEALRVDATDFMTAARTGELAQGRIAFRTNATGLADLTARRTLPGSTASASIQTTARLTDGDLALLRERRFAETDAAALEETRAASPSDRATMFSRVAVQVLGLLLLVSGLLVGGQLFAARLTAFSPKTLRPATSTVKFSAIAGCDEAKDEVSEVVEFLRDPERFTATGGRMPKGVLLVGPPGTGKTMLAKAVAGEAKANFYNLSGSDFVEMYVGVGASRVRSLFKKARENGPSIIFIDEIDAIGRTRSGGDGSGAQQEHDQTLNALLVAMDGFETGDAVIVFGATNRAETLDKALLRPGRFDRQVAVGLPDLRGRMAILQVHAAAVKLDATVDLEKIAKATPGYSGADLANLLNEGALHAARHRRGTVTPADLDEARDKINWGRETRRVMSEADKRVVAYHEAGHALMQVLSGEDALRLQKVTIIPRGHSLGSTHFSPERDLFNYSRELLISRLRCLMAGRAAEELTLGTITSGASGDIQEASRIARQMVFEYGMSPLGFMALASASDGRPLASPQTVHEAEKHVKALLDENYAITLEAMRTHRVALDAIAADLVARETISGDDVRAIVGTTSRAA